MNRPIDVEALQDKALLASFGLAENDYEQEILEAAGKGDTGALAELRAYRDALAHVAQTVPAVDPPAGLKEKLMARIAAKQPSLPPGWHTHEPGFDYVLNGDGLWKDGPIPGVKFQILHYDSKADLLTQLVKLEPGAKFPPHRHGAAEQCLVLDGNVSIGTLSLGKGDFNLAHPGTDHGEMTTVDGCLLLLINNPHDEILTHH